MSVVELPELFGHTIFCDDIRFEDGGKISLIGVYQGKMYVHADFPVTLPKFGILVRFHERLGSRSDSLVFKVFMPGDRDESPTIAGEVPMEELRKQVVTAPAEEGDEPRFNIVQANFLLSPLIIKEPGAIKVRAVSGSRIVRMGAMSVLRAAPAPSAS